MKAAEKKLEKYAKKYGKKDSKTHKLDPLEEIKGDEYLCGSHKSILKCLLGNKE